MPIQFFSISERERLDRFPTEIEQRDLITFFTITDADRRVIPAHTGAHNRLGFALQLCTLRFMGFVPDDFTSLPPAVGKYVAHQLAVDAVALSDYGLRLQTRTDHLLAVMEYLGFRKPGNEDLDALAQWLLDRALEHDKPSLLYELACEKFRLEKIVRPGVSLLERLIAAVRQNAQDRTMEMIQPLLDERCRTALDELLLDDPAGGGTLLSWLRREATSNSPQAILDNLVKIRFLRSCGVDTWRLDGLNPNRLKFLAGIARRSTAQALRRAPDERRYPMLVAFLVHTLTESTDETVDMFEACLGGAYARAGRELKEFRETSARSTNEKVRLFHELGRAILNPTIPDPELRRTIHRSIGPDELRAALEDCEKIMRPLDDNYFDLLESRYSYLRQFIPAFLATFAFQSNVKPDPLLEAVDLLRHLNAAGNRSVPASAPATFASSKWRPYLFDGKGGIDRHYYELCVLSELRGALRAGNVWLSGSRRYADPETYLIERSRWPTVRQDVCRQIQAPPEGQVRLRELANDLHNRLARVDELLASPGEIRMENGDLIISSLEAEEKPETVKALEWRIDERLPLVELSDLLIEVDRWTQFSQHFVHAGGSEPRSKDFLRLLYATLLAQGCNIGLSAMAQAADLSEDRLAWCSNWYLREETVKAAITTLVNFHHAQPLSRHWGGGTLSSSDGQRFPVSGKIRNATALPRYFGYGRGVTFYTWTSDQFSQYGTKVIPATVRDATYVLDEILDNETELSIVEHTTDTAGYTELIFALFDLLGMQFCPRIRDLGDQRLFRLDRASSYPHLGPQLKGMIDPMLILDRWDDLLRVAGSLKLGWVTASLLIGKLQSYPRQNALTRALQEYGKLVKTLFILRYLESQEYRRRINTQLNKGESLHALRRFLFFANEGKIRKKQTEEQTHQAGCLNLLTNAVIVWNTVYMDSVIREATEKGMQIDEEDLAHVSPARSDHINRYGRYSFDVDAGLARNKLRPLRAS